MGNGRLACEHGAHTDPHRGIAISSSPGQQTRPPDPGGPPVVSRHWLGLPELGDTGLYRSTDDRVVSGVAGGLAERLQVDTGVIRIALVVLATAGGAGLALYALAHGLLPERTRNAAGSSERSARRALGVALITAGILVILRGVGIWFADSLTWSVGLAGLGSAVVWTRAGESERIRWRASLQHAVGRRQIPDLAGINRLRLSLGLLLVLIGMITFLISADVAAATDVIVAALVTLIGMALVVGPWLQELGRQVTDERRERIRSEERADMAAHLHDSVLQTLALIQRAESPEEMTLLARGQERELRSWLFGRRPDEQATRLGQAVEDVAGRVEDRYGVKVDVVLAGDVALDDDLWALVRAANEAMTNAAKHAGVPRVDVFVEVDALAANVFIRDEGTGFDPAAVDRDRQGLSQSIVGRMRRHGGTAQILAAPGQGTEVELRLPLSPNRGDQ